MVTDKGQTIQAQLINNLDITPFVKVIDCFLLIKHRSRMTAREGVGARWQKLGLEREKQRLTDSTLETGGCWKRGNCMMRSDMEESFGKL